MNERTPNFTWMLGFLAASAAGAGVALLLAPQSGRDVRRKLAHRVGRAGFALASDGCCALPKSRAEPVSDRGAARIADWEAEDGGEA
jgi:gas vesicle protein